MHPIFPVIDCGGIDAEFVRKLPLRQPSRPAGGTETFGEGGCRRRGIVAQKSNDGRDVVHNGLGFVAFPVRDGRCTDPDLLANLLLEKSKIDSAGADMVT